MTSAAALAQPADVGLTGAKVAERVAAGRTNANSPDSNRNAWHIVRANVFTLFNGIVFACFFVLFLAGRWQDALFGFAAFANSIIACVQSSGRKRRLTGSLCSTFRSRSRV